MLSYHYADQTQTRLVTTPMTIVMIGHYTNDNNHVKEHFQLEYKNDWQLRYMNFLENRSNQELMNRPTNQMKQFISGYLNVLQQRKESMSTGMNLQTSF